MVGSHHGPEAGLRAATAWVLRLHAVGDLVWVNESRLRPPASVVAYASFSRVRPLLSLGMREV